MTRAGLCALLSGIVAATGCQGTREQLFVGVVDAAGTADGPCPWPAPGGLLAEWRADGNTRNEITCSPFAAQIRGTVPYGMGASGSAWLFRSQRTTGPSDGDYVEVAGSAGHVYPAVTVDVWVKQTHFNDYGGSDRVIVGTAPDGFPTQAGSWMMYVHEDTSLSFYVRLREVSASSPGVDYASCSASGPNGPTRTPIGSWGRYTATYDGLTLRCYRDGSLAETAALPGSLGIGSPVLVIGRNYPGDIDSVRIFERALDAAEIARPWP